VRILVTGGAGFIGSWLIESLLAAGHAVAAIDSLSPQIHGEVPDVQLPWIGHPRLQFERGDVRGWERLDRLLANAEAVVHLAAETGTGQSMYQIRHYYDVNVQSTASLLELIGSRHKSVRRIVLASSRSVYGEGAYDLNGSLVVPSPRTLSQLRGGRWEVVGPGGEELKLIATPESAPVQPASFYAATKLAVEQLGRVFSEAYGANVTALRLQNVYGERQSLRNPYTGILSIFSNRLRQNLSINIFEDGNESRDFIHISDVVRAIGLALDSRTEGFDVVNIGSGQATSVLEIATRLSRLLESKSDIRVTGDFRVGDIRHCFADLTNAKKSLGYAPAVSLQLGLEQFARWVLTKPVQPDRSAEALRMLAEQGLGKASD
jgi:dTDP-L-rhamnose 4-epimerase